MHYRHPALSHRKRRALGSAQAQEHGWGFALRDSGVRGALSAAATGSERAACGQ